MRIGIILPGFSAHENDPAIPVQHHLMRRLSHAHDVRVLATRYPHTNQPYPFFDAQVVPLGYTHQARGLKRFRLWQSALQTLQNLHQSKPFDILHAMWADETGLIAVRAGKRLNIPVVVSVLGGELVGLRDIQYGLQRSAFSRWIVRQAIQGADVVIVACAYIERLLQPYHPKQIARIVMGVDTELFKPVATTPPNKLIHVASLVPVKDQGTLLHAVAQLPTDITLDIIGEGYLLPQLRQLASELQMAHRVNFLGTLPHAHLPQYYQGAALHILPSRHEALGMVTLEAAACGLPTVGTDVGLLPDFPQLGRTITVGDDSALATAILNLMEESTTRNKLGQTARLLVEQHFSIDHTVTELSQLYRQLHRKFVLQNLK